MDNFHQAALRLHITYIMNKYDRLWRKTIRIVTRRKLRKYSSRCHFMGQMEIIVQTMEDNTDQKNVQRFLRTFIQIEFREENKKKHFVSKIQR
ncbi:unnamed protein product [Paramecium sonneborni]|uniref:Uncharacterized protein n=1 Tax=Paramecium sonneborni TaxID=65129 RepID=A0A8S1MUH6_9CILI|nr:unnamed protein product [Paramecium sonneborni]